MSCWLLSIVHVISTCTATKILYVLPDNVSDVNCPSQSCATLGQYLLDNGSLPVLSDVEYHFLPGEHHVVNFIHVYGVFNFSLIGTSLSPANLVCWSQSYVAVLYSYNVIIKNLMFVQCNGDLFTQLNLGVMAGLFLYECSYCKVKDLQFFGYGFAGINLFQKSYLSNITVDMTIIKPAALMCNVKFFLMFKLMGTKHNHHHDSVLVNQVFINGYGGTCKYNEQREVMAVILYKIYDIHVELSNSQFHNLNQMSLYFRMKYTNASLLIKNCTFTYTTHKVIEVVYGTLSINNIAVKFDNCVFYHNTASDLLRLHFAYHADGLCVYPSNITIENCDFTDNKGSLLMLFTTVFDCKPNIFFKEFVNFALNKATYIMQFSYINVYMSGTITVFKNDVTDNIIRFEDCNITFTETIMFLSNTCDNVIYLMSVDLPYMVVMEYANISFVNTTHHHHLVLLSGPLLNNYGNIFPYCCLQYFSISTSNKSNITELITHYTISFSGNTQILKDRWISQMNSIQEILTHCKWLPTAIFKGHDPGYVNQQIIKVDGHQWIHHKKICHCPHGKEYNCTEDLLGSVYPGQRLQVDLCMPQAEPVEYFMLYAETHSTSLPSSACKIARQTELINRVTNRPEVFNFTIISENETCELFFRVENYIRSAFYVKLLPCPVTFTLQNGRCDCDPFLPPDIDTCYIDLSSIRRPANIWITAHTLTNNTTNYLISDCPMDYCLPHSTNINLLHPDLQCQFNRTGILCSQCPHPLSMVFASSRCMKCTNVHILITIIVIVAGIVLVVLLYVLNLTVTNGTVIGIIFYANIVSINDSVFLVNDNVSKTLRVFISFTNLDLGIETCFYNGMDSYVKMWLQLFFPSYLIFIAVSIIVSSRYSTRVLRLTYHRSLPVLATLFLLSYTGVLRVVLTVLFSYSTITHYPSGDKQIVWSIDASVPLFGLKFIILFITCIVLFLILIPFNITLLFTRCLSRFRVVNHFKPLLDAFQGSHKDKYYYWIAVQLMFRSIFFSLYAFQVKLRLIIATILLMIFTGYYGYLQPNKNKTVNFQELSILINLTIMYAVSVKDNEKIFSIITNTMISLALIQFCIIVLCHFLIYTCHCKFSIKEKLAVLFSRKKCHSSFNVALLDIPERTYNYSEYQDGLVSDDFK